VAILYAGTAWIPFGVGLRDIFVLALITSCLVFALAGFDMVFMIEEMVYDAHRHLHVHGRLWHVIPSLLVLCIVLAIPAFAGQGGPSLPALRFGAAASAVLLSLWWIARLARPMPDMVLRELHIFVFAILMAT